MGLKIIQARLVGANRVLNDILENSDDAKEKEKARTIKKNLFDCLKIIKE
jgi:hypothetical protein